MSEAIGMLGRASREVITSWKLRCRGMTGAKSCDKEAIPTHHASLPHPWNASQSIFDSEVALEDAHHLAVNMLL